ncbi:interleukin-13 receptor subunit alpha-1-like [Centroberyx affinis]|uniref:interleukin-13 receptor subunit alpha-1-like n=1 Tax=Centroberyx affinis TaxID=166261 RepID=UPI003A5BE5CD
MTHFTLREVFTIIICTAMMTAVQCVADRLPPPQNLSCEMTDEFCIKLSWQKPSRLEHCSVKYRINGTKSEIRPTRVHYNCITTEEIGSAGLRYTIETIPNTSCGSRTTSKPLNCTIYPPVKLVSDFKCFLYSSDVMNCSWIPENQFPDLEVFYKLCGYPKEKLSKCEHLYSNGMRKGCHLKGNLSTEAVCILVRGTSDGATVLHNTFKRKPSLHVRTPPPKLTITEQGDELTLSWTAPDIGKQRCWTYIINYSTCDESREDRIVEKQLSMTLSYDKRCLYKFQIRANFAEKCGKGESLISEVVSYGRDEPPDPSLTVAVIVIPAILSVCVILSWYCFRRHRAIICPIVPDPSVIFKEMMNKTKEPKTTTGNLYIPVPEVVESWKLTPVAEVDPPQPNS